MKGKHIIYGIYCYITSKIMYIGQTTHGRDRFCEHFTPSRKERNKKIQEYFLYHKPMYLEIEQVDCKEMLDEREKYWISYFKNKNECSLNEFIGKNHSERTKDLIKLSNHNRGCKNETKKRISESNTRYIFTYENKKILGIKKLSEVLNIPISTIYYRISNKIDIPKVVWDKM